MRYPVPLCLCGSNSYPLEGFARDERVGVCRSYFLGELGDASTGDRVDPVRHELGGRHQGERPLVQAGMGNFELRAAPHQISSHEEIEIEDSWTPPIFGVPPPTGCRLEFTTPVKQIEGVSRPAE